MRLIDADALIRMLKSPNTFWNHYKDANEAVNMVRCQRTEMGWIPCSEKMPETTEDTLITTTNGVTFMAFHDIRGWVVLPTYKEGLTFDDHEVIAWIPLPEPFKGE